MRDLHTMRELLREYRDELRSLGWGCCSLDEKATAILNATSTCPTIERKVLMCRLKRHVVTDSDFIPAGTPVQVLGWTGNDDGGPGAKDASGVEVRATAYMYADTFDYDARTTAVGVGLCFSVKPSNLEFMSITDA